MTFSPHNSARDAPAAQSSRKVPWSDVANSASAGHELPAYTALYGQLGDEELVIRPSGEPENDAEKPENPTSSGSPRKIAREGARFSGSLCGQTPRA